MADAPSVSRVMRSLWRDLAAVDGFMEGASIFSEDDADRAYFVNGTQVANLTPDGRLALRLTRGVISQHRLRLKADERVDLRRSGSDWIGVAVRTKGDADLALELARLVAEAHWPEGGTLRLPPEGSELARRRRFH